MEDHSYNLKHSPASHGAGVPLLNATFRRITVLLGANGTGKSKAMVAIRGESNAFGGRPVLYIEGGRVVPIPGSLQYDPQAFNDFFTIERGTALLRGKRTQGILNRSRDAFFLLDRKEGQLKSEHSDAVTRWKEGGFIGECPVVGPSPLQRLFSMFSQVFPEITVGLEGENRALNCRKDGQSYSATYLSDGERQVLFVLADIALTAEPNSLIIVDEPELNLNAQLAVRLWDTVEAELPQAVFVYATHSIGFAMRPNVEQIIALGGSGKPAMQVGSIADIAPDDARQFLGAIPAILAAPAALAVEGEESSFDAPFYEWLLGRPDVAVIPIGNCHDVAAATSRTGVWDRLAPGAKLGGVIDRDYREDAKFPVNGSCIILDYHEAESYLCHPGVFSKIAKEIGIAKQIPEESDVTQFILQHFEKEMLLIAVKRLAVRAQVRLSVSVERALIISSHDEVAVRSLVQSASDQESRKAEKSVGPVAAVKIFDEELRRCQWARDKGDIESILRLVPGKALLGRLAGQAGVKDPADLARAAFRKLAVDDFTCLRGLKERLAALVG